MKNIIRIALLCITTSAFSQQEKQQNIMTANTSWNGKRCNGSHGLCYINSTNNKAETNTKIIYNQDNTVTFIIDRSKITKEDEAKIISVNLNASFKPSQSIFIMEDDFELEMDDKSRLQIPLQLTKIPKGNYVLTITKDTFTIIFKLE